MATHLDLPTLPVSTNIGLSSHTDAQTHTYEQTRTLSCTRELIKTKEQQPAKASSDAGFKYRRDERARLHGFKERKDGGRQKGRGVQRGNMGRSKGYFRVNPLLDCLRAVGCQQAWEQTPTNVTQGLVYMRSSAAEHTHTHTLLNVHSQRQTGTHIISTEENTKINIINTPASEEITCFLS